MFTQHYPGVLAYVRRRTTDDPGDAVSEVFLTAWRRFDDVPGDALPWLLGVARRVLANTRRSAARRPALPVANVDAALESSAQERLEVAEAFSRLGERDREVLMLVAWDGLPPERAARALGCSATAFRVRLHRARGRLERALGDADPGHARDESAQELSTPREAE
ncbi:MAG TPA: sigma-70 family RNA polymerase sigma factor [Actinomycetota bacterium]|nr:sigma-70 family RNA polymerase sigma factor [Actinomycetota bacterium]